MRSFRFRPYIHAIFPTFLLLITPVFAVAQSTGSPEDAATSSAANSGLNRIERARALAAVHQLQAAATELENVRASAKDVALRNVAALMLIGIYLEDGNYGRSQTLLEEAFAGRTAQKDESMRTYFAAAGQTINGVRSHLARYRSFGLNPGDTNLAAEAATDLERVRGLLERVIAQANEISKEQGRAYESLALLEDVLSLRMSLARNDDDRGKWQTEFLMSREKMASSQIQVASLGRSPALNALTARIPNPFSTPKTDNETAAANSTSGPVTPNTTTPNTTIPNTTTPGDPAATATLQPSAATNPGTEPQLVTAGSLSGRELKRVMPSYPSAARSTNISGTVRVFAIVDENGKVWVTNSEGPMILRKAAEEAARAWTFPPSTFAGKSVRIAGYLDFEFKL